MVEINVMSLFGAVETARADAIKTGIDQTVRLSDYAARHQFVIVPFCDYSGEWEDNDYYYIFCDTLEDAETILNNHFSRRDWSKAQIVEYDPDADEYIESSAIIRER